MSDKDRSENLPDPLDSKTREDHPDGQEQQEAVVLNGTTRVDSAHLVSRSRHTEPNRHRTRHSPSEINRMMTAARAGNKALISLARRRLKIMYAILRDKTPYHAPDLTT